MEKSNNKTKTNHIMKSFHNLSQKSPSAHCGKTAMVVLCLFALVVITGCASTKVTNREQLVTGPIPRPNTIWVYNFAATAADVPTNSSLAGEDLDTTPQTAEEIAEGMKLGDQIATELVWQINAMGMQAQ